MISSTPRSRGTSAGCSDRAATYVGAACCGENSEWNSSKGAKPLSDEGAESDGLLTPEAAAKIALQSIRWPHPGDGDVATTSCIYALCHLAIHAIEAFSRRRGVAIDSVVYQRACNEAQLLYLLTRRQLDFLV
jgi:hypothetical protein